MSITPTGLSSYYNLPTQTSTNSSTASTPALPQQQSVAGLLLAAEKQSDTSGSDTVILSPAAQGILNSSTSSGFTLTAAQQQQITQILQKYANTPLTQDTFDQIQDDLKAVGLSPSQLAGKDIASGFSTTADEVSAFNGDATDTGPSVADEQSKVQTFLNQIYSQLQSIQSQAASAATTATSS